MRRSVAANGTTSQVPPHHSQILTFGPSVVVALMLADSLFARVDRPGRAFWQFYGGAAYPGPWVGLRPRAASLVALAV